MNTSSRTASTARRQLIVGLASLLVAPAIVRASSLMPIRGERYFFWEYSLPLLPPILERDHPQNAFSHPEIMAQYTAPNGGFYRGTWTFYGKTRNIYSDETVAFRKEEYPRERWNGDQS